MPPVAGDALSGAEEPKVSAPATAKGKKRKDVGRANANRKRRGAASSE